MEERQSIARSLWIIHGIPDAATQGRRGGGKRGKEEGERRQKRRGKKEKGKEGGENEGEGESGGKGGGERVVEGRWPTGVQSKPGADIVRERGLK